MISAAKSNGRDGPIWAGFSIVSLVIALLGGVSAALLFSYASKCRELGFHRNEAALQTALATLRVIVVYWGILTLIGIILAIIGFIYAMVLS